MAAPAICTVCGYEHKYPATKGWRLASMHCVACGRPSTLTRCGRNPSSAAVATRRARRRRRLAD